jgi:hypothetical protein
VGFVKPAQSSVNIQEPPLRFKESGQFDHITTLQNYQLLFDYKEKILENDTNTTQ